MRVIEVTGETAVAGDRNTIGGWPILGPGQAWPDCDCGARMALFFQIDVPDEVPAFGGEHLLVFQCPVHNDACFGPRQLPERYWDRVPDGNPIAFWKILRHRGGVVAETACQTLAPLKLTLTGGGTDVEWEFRAGGEPAWIQGAERHVCACGTELQFLVQVPENLGFPQRPGVPEQDGAFSSVAYGLFLGNMVYVLACPDRCDPAAAWPVLQN